MRTLMLNVYMAKLAVLISTPKTVTMHWPLELSPQGVSRSDNRTPFSLARLSNRIGMKEAVWGWVSLG